MSRMLKHFENPDLKQNVLLLKHKEFHYFSLLLFCQPFKLDLNGLNQRSMRKESRFSDTAHSDC